MERNFTEGVQNREESTMEVGKDFLESDSDTGEERLHEHTLWTSPAAAEFNSLLALHRSFDDNASEQNISYRIPKPLGFDHLEMLEAELVNQGILLRSTEYCCGLAQQATHEANIWRWRAQRFGIDSALTFDVNLAFYVEHRAQELLFTLNEKMSDDGFSSPLQRAKSWQLNLENQGSLLAELQYLNRFAAYLMGGFDEAINGYQRGLNLVLRVLCTKAETRASMHKENPTGLHVTLPISRREFFSQLKAYRDNER